MKWENILKTPPSVNDWTKGFEAGKKVYQEALGLKETPPFKGSKHREKSGWMDKLNTFNDTNAFLHILDEIYSMDKDAIFRQRSIACF